MIIEWSATRLLSKVNYVVHTDAIKECIIPNLTESQKQHVYSDEADILNVALFGMTAKQWRDKNPELAKNGNIRDYTTIHPRCGTTFMFLVLTVSILLYMFTSYFVYTYIYASYTPPKIVGNLTVLAINIILLPIVSGISYEILKLGFKFYNFPLMRLAILPGLALQKITTRRPQDDEIEVALFALSKLLDTSIEKRTEEEVQADIKKSLENNDNIKDNATEEKLCV